MRAKRPTHGDGVWLKTAREEMRLSQEEMGRLLGVGQVAVSHYETGRNKRLSKLARREIIRLLAMTDAERAAALVQASPGPAVPPLEAAGGEASEADARSAG